jgi:PhnB protein
MSIRAPAVRPGGEDGKLHPLNHPGVIDMPQLNAYLTFDGNCAEAMRFYERILGGKLDIMTFGQSPMSDQMPPGSGDRVMHARLTLDGGVLMASDSMPGQPFDGIRGCGLALNYPQAADARRIFDALAEGGRVTMPPEKTFWAELFGMVVDRFGTPWLINGGQTMG